MVLVDRQPVRRIRRHLEDLRAAEDEIGRDRLANSGQIQRMVAAQRERRPAGSRAAALG